eukprot:gene565-855_t
MGEEDDSGRGERGRGSKRGRGHGARNSRRRKRAGEIVPRIDNYENARIQALMVGDKARTGAYHDAVMQNKHLFEGKVIMDVGAGQGILSMFAAKAGAKKVYAVERSHMSRVAAALVKANGLQDVVEVCNKDVDLLEIPEKVDLLISEWMGIGLVHERMLEVVLRARDKFLKPVSEGGAIFPTTATIFLAPLYEDNSESELFSAETWSNAHHYGIDWSVAQKMLPYDDLEEALVPAEKVPDGVMKGVFKADINPKSSGYFFEIDDNVNTNLYMDSAKFLWQECR